MAVKRMCAIYGKTGPDSRRKLKKAIGAYSLAIHAENLGHFPRIFRSDRPPIPRRKKIEASKREKQSGKTQKKIGNLIVDIRD